MTWKQFKKAVEAEEVKDDTELAWIDWHSLSDHVDVDVYPDDRCAIY